MTKKITRADLKIDSDALQRPITITRRILAERILALDVDRRRLGQRRVLREIGGRLHMYRATTHG